MTALESELRFTKENLQATIEEMETSNEELQATNEELIASNEELQSTNEELHSVNEELYTVNGEYQAKIAELTELTADMNHLLEAHRGPHAVPRPRAAHAQVHPAHRRDLQPAAPGRGPAASRPSPTRLQDDAPARGRRAGAAPSGATVEREVRDRQGGIFFLRILPYRGREDASTGWCSP